MRIGGTEKVTENLVFVSLTLIDCFMEQVIRLLKLQRGPFKKLAGQAFSNCKKDNQIMMQISNELFLYFFCVLIRYYKNNGNFYWDVLISVQVVNDNTSLKFGCMTLFVFPNTSCFHHAQWTLSDVYHWVSVSVLCVVIYCYWTDVFCS